MGFHSQVIKNRAFVLAMDEKKIQEVVERMVSSFKAHYTYHFDKPDKIETIRGELFCDTDLAVAGDLPKCSIVQFHVASLMEKDRSRFMIIFPSKGENYEQEFIDILATVDEIVERVKVILRDYDKVRRIN